MSSVALNRLLIILGNVGIFISGFLSLSHRLKLSLPCGAAKGCDVVTTHQSAYLTGDHFRGGIPVAYLGLLGYVALTVLAIYRATSNKESNKTLTTIGFVLSAAGALYSGYLTYTALYVIHATCWWCISSAATMVLTTIVYAAMLQSDKAGEKGAGKLDVMVIGASTVAMVVALTTMITMRINSNEKIDGQSEFLIAQKQQEGELELVGPNAHILGNKEAPVTIVEFADLLCPTCQQNFPILEDLVKNSNGKIRLVFHHFPLFQLEGHKMAIPAAAVAEMAAEEGKFFPFIAEVYSKPNSEMQNNTTLLAIAKSLGMDVAKIEKRLTDSEDQAIKRVTDDINLAHAIKINGTPTLFVQAKGGKFEQVASSGLERKLNEEPYRSLILGGGTGN